jgi:hypothetical protein
MSHRVAVPALCALFALAGFFSLRGDSATFDETAHIAAGVAYAERGDFRLNPEHPPLVKYLSGSALVLTGRGGLDYGSTAWDGADPWTLGRQILRQRPAERLVRARLPVLALGVVLLLAVYGFTREMHGQGPALLALALAATCPTLLAHARLVTTDLAAALGATLTLWAAWRWLRAPSWRRLVLVGIALGTALLSKYSCVLLVPALAGLVSIAAATRRIAWRHALTVSRWRSDRLRRRLGRLRSSDTPRHRPLARMGVPGAARRAAFRRPSRWARPSLAPEAYLFGIAYARAESKERVAFLDGEESVEGWWRYFPRGVRAEDAARFHGAARVGARGGPEADARP